MWISTYSQLLQPPPVLLVLGTYIKVHLIIIGIIFLFCYHLFDLDSAILPVSYSIWSVISTVTNIRSEKNKYKALQLETDITVQVVINPLTTQMLLIYKEWSPPAPAYWVIRNQGLLKSTYTTSAPLDKEKKDKGHNKYIMSATCYYSASNRSQNFPFPFWKLAHLSVKF